MNEEKKPAPHPRKNAPPQLAIGFVEQVLTPDDGEATAEEDLAEPDVELRGARG